jgi:hypothetical protein
MLELGMAIGLIGGCVITVAVASVALGMSRTVERIEAWRASRRRPSDGGPF